MIDEDAPQPCLKCGQMVAKVTGTPEIDGGTFMADVAPDEWEGMQFHRQLEITVCGACLTDAGRAGRVVLYAVTVPIVTPEPRQWRPSGLRAV